LITRPIRRDASTPSFSGAVQVGCRTG
jgi:hypothetical protein